MDRPIKKNIKGIDVYYIKSSKFKTITWSFVFTHEKGNRDINEYYFLSNILVDNMKKYPTFVKKYRYLSSLYGLDAFSSALVIGDHIINQFVVTYPNEKYIDTSENLSLNAFNFLNEVITNPKTRDGHLTRKVFKDSLDEAKQSFNILKSIKDMYAYYRFSQIYYQDKPNLQYNFPDNDRLNETSLEKLNVIYRDMLVHSDVSLFVTGDFDDDLFDDIIEKNLSDQIKTRPILHSVKDFPYDKNKEVKQVTEYADVSQARVFIGFQTDIQHFSSLHPALGVFNDIFGGFDQSKLFMDIRERSHLAYYVDSHYLSEENLVVIPIVCDFNQVTTVIEKVKKALQE
ncbi:MAG TPA: insulinase family protein, partial [Bacillota bacterium]|nr:insulinase family protein [Bacillota bacterium]